MRRLTDLRLIPGVERPVLGAEIEKTVSLDQHRKLNRQRSEESTESDWPCRRQPASPFADRRLVLDEQDNGDVLVTRPDGRIIRICACALESTTSAATSEAATAKAS